MARKTGRKPRGDFSEKKEWLSTRITKETRKALEIAAAHGGRSLSQEIERRIVATFEDFRKDREQFTSGLGYLLGQVALMLPMGGDFRTDRLKHEALVVAAIALLKRLEPKDPPVLPDGVSLEDAMRRAQEFGITVAAVVWKQLVTMPEAPSGLGEDVKVPMGSWLYAYPSARRDLGVEFDVEEADAWLTRNSLAKALMEKKENKDE